MRMEEEPHRAYVDDRHTCGPQKIQEDIFIIITKILNKEKSTCTPRFGRISYNFRING